MSLFIYNSLTRKKEEFKPITEGNVGIYVCGPTVYSLCHIGHSKSYVSFDTIIRYFRWKGYRTTYVQNITDVGHLTDDADEGEDKILKQARIERIHPMQIAEMFTYHYFQDMDSLGVIRPDICPRATGHIPEQIEFIEKLLEKEYAYISEGNVYFDTSKFKEYGKLSGRNLDEIVSGTRVEIRTDKHHPADFALWKKAETGHIMRWKSPWSIGYPGWHIECSAMSMKYLGESFDIHGGGLDNQFPHHECEIAQSEALTSKPFVKYWLHNNLVTTKGQKMGKSLGNFLTLQDAFKIYDPLAIRFFVLQSHYRSILDFSDEALNAAAIGLEKLHNSVKNLRNELYRRNATTSSMERVLHEHPITKRFIEAMDDDFGTPQALAVLFELAHNTNQALALSSTATESLVEFDTLFRELGGKVLGIIPETITSKISMNLESKLIDLAIQVRSEARKQKLFTFSDLVRNGLKKLGIILEDSKDGTTWKLTKSDNAKNDTK